MLLLLLLLLLLASWELLATSPWAAVAMVGIMGAGLGGPGAAGEEP